MLKNPKYPYIDIEDISVEQEALIPVYRDKWLKNGYSTERLNRLKTTEAIDWFYETQLKKPKPIKWYCSGPLEAIIAIAYVKKIGSLKKDKGDNLSYNLRDNLVNNLGTNLGNNLWTNLGNNLRDNLRDNLSNNLRNNLSDNLWDSLETNLGTNLRTNLWTNLWDNLSDNLRDNLRNNLEEMKIKYEPFFDGNWIWGWQGFYDFVLNELFKNHKNDFSDFQTYLNYLEHIHILWPFEDICFYSDRPVELYVEGQENKRLHHESKPALLYADGTSLYSLNGVRMPEWVITTPKSDLDTTKILAINNAEVRMQAIKHAGLSRFDENLKAKIIHEWKPEIKANFKQHYQLLYLTIEGNETGPYLRMVNPSTGEIHTEGVGDPNQYEFKDNSITTCQQALAFKWRVSEEEVTLFFNEKASLT